MALLILGLLLITGLLAGLGSERLGVPRVAAYVVTGMLFSEHLLGGVLGIAVDGWTEPFTSAALGIIAYLIGGSVTVRQLRVLGRVILWGTLGQTLGALLLVLLALLGLAALTGLPLLDWRLALAFAVLATTTAPAATVAVLHQYRASGPLTSCLLGVVALDDALGILLFSLMLVLVGDGASTNGLVLALWEVVASIALGSLAGWALSTVGRQVHKGALRLPLILGTILVLMGLAQRFHLSPLLTAMMAGFVARAVTGATGDRLFHSVERLEETVFIAFFTLAGSHFEPQAFFDYWMVVLVYFVARILGKVSGAQLGARLGGAPPHLARNLGLGLIPQAGVAVGLALTLANTEVFAELGKVIINIVLAATLLNELVGPITTRLAIRQAGEAGRKHKGGTT